MNGVDVNKKVIFIAYICNFGGIETLIIRMSRWLNHKGIAVEVLGDKDRIVDEKLVNELTDAGALVTLVSFRYEKIHIRELKTKYFNQKVQCIVFSYVELILADKIFGSCKTANIIFYDAHQYNLIADFYASGVFVKKVLRCASSIVVKRLYCSHKIVFMDPLCKKRTLEEFHLNDRYEDDIIYLPMEVSEYADLHIKNKIQTSKEFKILTVSRMVFPFKGYVFGLMDLFSRLVPKYPQLRLTVIGTGEDEEKFLRKYETIDNRIRERITWIKGVPYEEIKKYMEESRLYIGMGTTIIDAINCGVPALSVGSYTYECKGYDYFYKNPENLGGIEGNIDIQPYVENIVNLSESDYISLSKKDHMALKEMYDIEVVGTQILNYQNNKKQKVFNIIEEKIIEFIKSFTA